MQEQVEKGIDLREFGTLLVRRVWILVVCAVLLGAVTMVYTKVAVTPLYEASISVYVNNSAQKDSMYVSSQDLAVAIRLAETYVNIIRSDRVLEKVIERTGINATPAQLRRLISAEPVEESEMFTVTVISPHPQVSADVANVIAEVAPGEISTIIEGSSAKVIDFAKPNDVPVSPNVTSNTVIGGVLGVIIGLAIVFLELVLDTRVRGEEDLMRIGNLPILGVIPDMSGPSKKKGFLRR